MHIHYIYSHTHTLHGHKGIFMNGKYNVAKSLFWTQQTTMSLRYNLAAKGQEGKKSCTIFNRYQKMLKQPEAI